MLIKDTNVTTDILERAKKLKLLILDVDGVLTDGKLFFDQEGNEYKCFHARDGHGIKLELKSLLFLDGNQKQLNCV